ncbi:hypothetical protein COB55_01145 [Candidatus Wolfebacteria bacterium]|nr:MAG: hypothetical protein COB55_01145 [Candidatus Wolfebacteria bacterium]
MKIFHGLIKISLVIALFAVLPAVASAAPGIPHQFYGTVTFSGDSAPDGLVVKVSVDGETVGTSSTTDGKYGYSPDLLFAINETSDWSGETAVFTVGGVTASQTASLERGGYAELALTLSGSVGSLTVADGGSISNQVVVVTSSSPTQVSVGSDLAITISSDQNTSATITTVEELSSSFFSGATGILSGNNLLKGFEINITGDNLTISVTITYDDSGIDESTIKPYRHDGTSWVAIDPFTIDTSANTLTFSVSSAQTPYVLFGGSASVVVQATVVAPSGGGGIVADTIAATTTIRGDIDQNFKVDIFDFNIIMVNWGGSPTNAYADLDGNGKVDIFDFNLLMVSWAQ